MRSVDIFILLFVNCHNLFFLLSENDKIFYSITFFFYGCGKFVDFGISSLHTNSISFKRLFKLSNVFSEIVFVVIF